MTGKMRFYIGFLVLTLVLIGGGLWFLFTPAPVIEIPEDEPIITMRNSYRTIGQGPDQLYIYEDGSVIYVTQKGIGTDSTNTWSTGKLQKVEMDELLELFTDGSFESLNRIYEFPGEQVDGVTKVGGMSCTITVNYKGMHKTADANQYLSPDGGMTYPDMPYPLNEIYAELKQIIENETDLVYEESIQE